MDRRRFAAAIVALVSLLGAVLTACGGGSDGSGGSSTTSEPPSTTTTAVPIARGRQMDPALYVPAIGDCFDRRVPDPDAPLTEVVLVLPCREPHQYEVFDLWTPEVEASDEITSSGSFAVPYPEVEDFSTEARNACVALLEDFADRPYELSVLEVEPLLPAPDQWDLGNRAVGCVALHREGELLEGSQRSAGV